MKVWAVIRDKDTSETRHHEAEGADYAAATRQGKLAAGFAILAVLFLRFSVGIALFTQGY